MDGRIDRWIDRWIDVSMDGRTDRQIDRQTDRQVTKTNSQPSTTAKEARIQIPINCQTKRSLVLGQWTWKVSGQVIGSLHQGKSIT